MSRRDSFITHRAFCDALAEETARVSAASEINSSLLRGNIGNYTNIMGTTSLVPNNNMPTHFPSIFKPISTPDHHHHHHHHESTNQTRGLSLWMNQNSHSQPHETMITTTNGNSSLHEIHQQLDSSSREIMYGGNENPPPYSNNYQLNWVFGTKLSNNCSQELITSTTTSLPLGNINVNVKDVSHDATSQQISSLYSSQHQIPHQTSSANMSATALLQKAAQIGSTSSDTSFLGSLGLKCSNNNSTNDVNKFGGTGMYGTSSSLLISLGNEEDHNNACDFSQMHPSKRRHVQGEENGGGGQTRDFLGVGVQTICHPSSINGWI